MVEKKLLFFISLGIFLIGLVNACHCGDQICNNNETCLDCPDDCGVCPIQPFCGDEIINQEFEECDYGLSNGLLCWASYGSTCEYCTSLCKLKIITNYCGDKIKQACEECDDGNNINGDGCSSECKIEIPEPIEFCGDGICNNKENCSTCELDCGTCPPEPECEIDSDCGEIFISENYCSANNVVRNLITPVCNLGFCETESTTEIVEECENYCENKECKEDKKEESKKISSSGYKLIGDFCSSDWGCSGWSECEKGLRTRTCVDKNHCDNDYNKPAESTGCAIISNALVPKETQKDIFPFIAIGVITFIVLLIVLINFL